MVVLGIVPAVHKEKRLVIIESATAASPKTRDMKYVGVVPFVTESCR